MSRDTFFKTFALLCFGLGLYALAHVSGEPETDEERMVNLAGDRPPLLSEEEVPLAA